MASSSPVAPVIVPPAGKRVRMAGHRGMVGSALGRRLERANCSILTVARSDPDLRDQTSTRAWLSANRPDVVFIAAALYLAQRPDR